ncbi:hypothetical protein AY606_14280 [Acinetobacter sp. SFB]|uniref:AAA family ATPase n=1 Tax=Acinetobacter sp. SFB TaxID=1805634 RepID=UPI0007D869B1|nr:AAA family ATPase [Acinetobacter sp. SFB]OAL80990.1 hypothetical protein AY606_14280 [Acinetobacter sp. SFB]
MKIKRIAEIQNFSIFKDFDWSQNLSLGNNQFYDFKDINIFYGRNYSGKTSLSKIIRSLEKKALPPKYDNPNFKIQLNDDSEINQSTLSNFQHSIHVYNSDFVKENLKFIHNENENIESFSVTLGDDNDKILTRIQELKNELGSNEENIESNLNLTIKNKNSELKIAKKAHKNAEDKIENILKNKASGNFNSIRSQPNLFGDQEYNVGKLKRTDIPLILNTTYQALTKEKEFEFHQILDQRKIDSPPNISTYSLNFSLFIKSTNETLKTVVSLSNKIEELTNNPTLNSWVQTGLPLHKNRATCLFCNNKISTKRYEELAQHFDQETQKIQYRISEGIERLDQLLTGNELKISFDINHYYLQYHHELSELKYELEKFLQKQKSSIEELKMLLTQKISSPFTALTAEYPQDFSEEIIKILAKVSEIRTHCIKLNDELSNTQKEAKEALRLNHIYHFLQDINYTQLNTDISLAFQAIGPLDAELTTLQTRKNEIEAEIKREEDKLKSEGEACNRIKDILNHDFGHQTLSLEPLEIHTTNGEEIKFEIQRNGMKAHNLSEGECSLISFCYFLAKIQDDLDQDKQPIIWIDDPICSLDSNHIFFIYSLINEKICRSKKFSQLFISTHNLDFLKYLKRLDNSFHNNGITPSLKRASFLIQRTESNSIISKMPNYLSEYATEFNYLFNQIHTCASTDTLSDENHSVFYNFSNNARKFIEVYSFYKFPTYFKEDDERLKAFWNDEIYRLFIGRVNNEYSHCAGVLERGMSLMDVPEMHRVAKAIIHKVKQDTNQYNALLESINVTDDPLSRIESPAA